MTTRPPAPPSRTGWPTYERSILSNVLGLPGYAAIAIAFGFTGLGVFIDLNRTGGDLGAIFKGCYFAGCVLAVCWVKRRALFGPMVQPPLLMALAIPSIVLLSGDSGANGSPGLADHLLSIGAPLLLGFPTMAVTTAFVVGIGIIRYLLQRPSQAPAPPTRRPANRRGAASAPGAGRGAATPGERRAAAATADRRGAPGERRTTSGVPGERRTTSGVPGERKGSGTPGERRAGTTERRTTSGVPGESRDQPKRSSKQRPTKQGGATSASGEQRAAGGREPGADRKSSRSAPDRASGDRRAARGSSAAGRQRSGEPQPPEPRSADRTARRS
ncbi:hypothetical protein GCM10023321_19880 [Pseudonocardia eucalypti]|uniref:DUF6542 domain-containing protein n=1 Tax=Pseudonocardia eucalypti TaxID=648755 RepID=A0ABP9PXP9_9PSEU|nr:hypothetical protein [Pseudonocardia eucalypti]